MCGEDHLWAGAREEGRSPSQGLAKGTFSDSVTTTHAAGTYPYLVQSPTNRYVPMGHVLGYSVWVRTCLRPAVSAMYQCIFPRRIEQQQQQRPSIHPPTHPILSHPTRPSPAWDNVISPDSIRCRPSNAQRHLMKRDEKHRSFSLMCLVCPSCCPSAGRARARAISTHVCPSKPSLYVHITASGFRLTSAG